MIVAGTTRVTLIIGHPIAQVRSPELFNRRFDALGADKVMIPGDVAPGQLANFLAALRGWHNCDGCVVTIPHKRAVVEHLDEITDRAARLQAVNVIRRGPNGRLAGDMVDGLGFMAAAEAHGFAAAGCAAAVVGAGGVGSAIADALCAHGIRELTITDVDAERAAWLCRTLGEAFPSVLLSSTTVAGLGVFDLVANATPVGMGGTGALPLPEALLATVRPDALVTDVVTQPPVTPFLAFAERLGCRIQTGPEMAAGQMEILGRFMGVMP